MILDATLELILGIDLILPYCRKTQCMPRADVKVSGSVVEASGLVHNV